MEGLQWLTFLGSVIFGIGWPLAALFMTFVLFALLRLRVMGIMVGSIFLGAAALAHMIMVQLQREIGAPESLYSTYIIQGVSFGELVTGRIISLEIGAGICGALCAIIGGMYISRRVSHLLEQIEDIPTSTARSAAIGLAEFKGIVGPANDEFPTEINWELEHMPQADIIEGGNIDVPSEYVLVDEMRQVKYRNGRTTVTESLSFWRWSSFYLEDGTGRILIDPRRIIFGGLIITAFLLGSSQVLNLTRNWESTRKGARRFLKPGDPVYVIGTVQMNEYERPDAKDVERLVVMPRTVHGPKDITKLTESPLITGNLDDIFILSDDTEKSLSENLRQGRKWVFMAAAVLAVLSALYLGDCLSKRPSSIPADAPKTMSEERPYTIARFFFDSDAFHVL